MTRNLILSIAALLAAGTASAGVSVQYEQLNPADPAWKFHKIPGPSKSDIAQNAKVSIVGNRFEPAGGDGSVLVNGQLPNDPLDLTEEALLANTNADGGNIIIDLGRVQPVAAVTSYSWHENPPDEGCRAPQVFTLFGSADDHANPTKPASWTKIADVDSRPNKTGVAWNGQHGVFISDSDGKLGDFRYLMFAVQPTRSPKQSNPAMTNTLFSEIDVHTAATLAKAGDIVVPPPVKVTDVWVAFKTHFDIGYTDSVENVLTKFRVTMMDAALKNFETDRNQPPEKRFSWTVPGWPLKHILGPLQDPARKQRIETAIREGSLVMEALPFSLHTETEDLEDLVRGLGFTSQLARQYDKPLPIAAKMTDVPSHSWVMPTLLANAGVKFLQIGCNGNSGHLRVPGLFWWEGPDGSRILCNYTFEYGSGLVPPKKWPAKNYLAMIMTGDNHGPPSATEVESIRNQAAKSLPGVRVHIGTLDDFARALVAENPALPTIRADMPDTWIHGWLSMPIESKTAHDIRPLEPALDTLDTQLRVWGIPGAPVAPALADAYEQSNLYSEHTFGPWGPKQGPWETGIRTRNIYGAEWQEARDKGVYRKYEAGFDPKRNYARKEAEIITRELTQRLDLLAKSVNSAGKRTVIYNALPWPRSGVVDINGKACYIKNVPASGYVTVTQPPDSPEKTAPTGAGTLDTPFYQVSFDLKRGGIASLIEKISGRELVDKSSPYALGQYLHERFDNARMLDFLMAYSRPPGGCATAFVKQTPPPDLTYAAMTPPAWNITINSTPTAEVATLTATDTIGLAKGLALKFTFFHDQPCVDAEWSVTEKTPNPLPEGGWLCFPFAIEQPQFLLGRLGGPVDPAKDIAIGANRHYFCLSTGLTITGNDKSGIGMCPLDSPCVSLGHPELWKYSLDHVAKEPAVFVNLYNNEWNTNFPEWQGGSWTSRVRLWPNTELNVPSWEARLPLLAATADGPAGNLPATNTGITVSRPGTLVTAFGQNPDGPGIVLRIWEQNGQAGELTVTLPATAKCTTATPVNLRGEISGNPIAITAGKLTFPLRAYAPASFVLQ